MPALLGGLFIGVLSALPVVQICNCCCLWIIGGGLLAAYLQQQNQPVSLTLAQFKKRGLIQTDGRKVILADREGLRSMA